LTRRPFGGAENMPEIDFSGLMDIGQAKGEEPVQRDAGAGNHELDNIKKINNQTLQGYKKQQEAKNLASIGKTEFVKDIQQGKDVYGLLLDAIDLVGIATGDGAFVAQTRSDLKAIYGKGLQIDAVGKKSRQEARKRLEKLRESLQVTDDPKDKQRIQTAIKKHEEFLKEN